MTENLNEYSIYVLREMARQAGVVSPTSKKKDQLIQEINEIREGKREPIYAKRQGRPPKSSGYSLETSVTQGFFNSNLVFHGSNEEDSIQDGTEFGSIELVNSGSALVWIRKGYGYEKLFVNSELVSKYGLKAGDEICAEIRIYDGQVRVVDVLSINGIPVSRMRQRQDYLDIRHSLPQRQMEFEKAEYNAYNIKYGESVYFYGNDNNLNTHFMINLLNSCKARHKIYVNVSIAEKNLAYLDGLTDTRLYVAKISDELDETRRIVDLAIEYAKRIIELGEDVVIGVDDVQSLAGIDTNMQKMKTLMSLTKNERGSISIFAIMSNSNLGAIEKLADKKFNIN